MTGDILHSDIELARRLISTGRSDGEIIAALVDRKISTTRAAVMVKSLREGKAVDPDPPSDPDFAPPVHPPVSRKKPKPIPERGLHPAYESKGSGIPWFTVLLLLVLGAFVAGMVLNSRRVHSRITAPENRETVGESRDVTMASPAHSPLIFELGPDGLMTGGTRLTRDSALNTLTRLLGPATRTNSITDMSKVVYTYDDYGVTFHSQDSNDCLVLYFEAVGGTNGTRQPFTGVLRIGKTPVQGSTDTTTLARIAELGLRVPATNSVVETTCYSTPLSFAYLESSERLSLVQIDLK
jgi:hypothetical protein